jgi:hypothetical protein
LSQADRGGVPRDEDDWYASGNTPEGSGERSCGGSAALLLAGLPVPRDQIGDCFALAVSFLVGEQRSM